MGMPPMCYEVFISLHCTVWAQLGMAVVTELNTDLRSLKFSYHLQKLYDQSASSEHF